MPVKESHEQQRCTSAPRRDFLKLMGFGWPPLRWPRCETPVQQGYSLPQQARGSRPVHCQLLRFHLLHRPDYNAVLVKSRDGRPIKLEGNPESPITRGGLSARAQAVGAEPLRWWPPAALCHQRPAGRATDQVDQEVRAEAGGDRRVALPSCRQPSSAPAPRKPLPSLPPATPTPTHVMYDAQLGFGPAAGQRRRGARLRFQQGQRDCEPRCRLPRYLDFAR